MMGMPIAPKKPSLVNINVSVGIWPFGPGVAPGGRNGTVSPSPRNGRSRTAPAATTPGTVRTLSSIARYTCCGSPSAGCRSVEMLKLIATRWSGAKPRSTCMSLMKLRVMRPAPTTSIIANATSVTTSAPRSDPAPCVLPRLPSRSVCCSSGDEARIAGTSPKTTPVRRETATVKTTTFASSPISSARGSWPPASCTRRRTPTCATPTPNAPPIVASTKLSVNSWRTMRPRAAPSATRIASSRSRAVARASNRLARFTDAMSSTNPTAPSSTSKLARTFPTIDCCSGAADAAATSLFSGYCSASPRAMALSSASACDSVTPGFIRATMLRMRTGRSRGIA